ELSAGSGSGDGDRGRVRGSPVIVKRGTRVWSGVRAQEVASVLSAEPGARRGVTLVMGSRTVNVVPLPRVLSTPISPPCAWAIHWEIARPRPEPPSARARD